MMRLRWASAIVALSLLTSAATAYARVLVDVVG